MDINSKIINCNMNSSERIRDMNWKALVSWHGLTHMLNMYIQLSIPHWEVPSGRLLKDIWATTRIRALIWCQKAVGLSFFLLIWAFVCRYFSNTSTQGRLSPSSAVWTCFDGGCQLTLTALPLILALPVNQSLISSRIMTHTSDSHLHHAAQLSTGLPAWLPAAIDPPSHSYVAFCALDENLVF